MRKIIKPTLLIILLFFFVSCIFQENNSNNLKFSISYFKDLQEAETIHSITNKKMLVLENPKIGFQNGIYWFKINLLDKKDYKTIIFDIKESTIADIIVYRNFEIIPYSNIEETHFSLAIDNHKKEFTYYFKVHFKNQVHFPLKIKEFKRSQLKEKYAFFTNGIYYGFVLMVLIVNVFFFFSLKDKTFLYYCLFLIAINLSISDYEGLLKVIIPSSLLKYSTVLTHPLIPIFGALFANRFLNLAYFLPKSNRIGLVLLFIAVLTFFLFIPTHKYVFIAIANTISLFILFYYWVLAVIILKKHQFAIFFVFGYSLILFSAIFFVVPVDLGFKTQNISLNTVKFGAIFEMLILTYAITYRIKMLHKENEKFKEEIKEYLTKINAFKSNNSEETNIESLIRENNLSDREADVLLLIFKGYTNQRIGDELFITLNTVKYHIRNIYQKLNINTKNEAIDIVAKIKNPK
ncbi:7TM diverse intracellular signaling domain-containing protein [Polaribacter porphyrae]|uniref:HTH luxR-type domain-containing protein n=1 Tax=Polaribacter porphyrae TaxID=1137780 RepID=A0A2S7WSH5_9FLAO|nr:7TM diverse intracellular signaling domain-containing protein [Polaribacter porphyrae]PQJ80271.1 hypothetical protein BTO18_14260 [Polaribacter porphyrae]